MSGNDGSEPDWLAETARARPRGSSPPDPATPQRFEERGELGRGGMGRVVEAYDRTLHRTVAIKQALDLAPDLVARFEREVRIAARLQHPGILAVLDAGKGADGRLYFVMPKVTGRPLAELIAGAATVRARLALVPNLVAAADAIAYAHARGIVHRDLKPANILVGEFGETLVIDWGLACAIDSALPSGVLRAPAKPGLAIDEPAGFAGEAGGSLTRTGHAYGTPGYMAPEQARGEASDRRSDVYALGATLYHVLAGAARHAELGDPSLAIAATARGEPALPAFADEVPAELGAIAVKAMAADRAARYTDGGELAADLRRFLTGQLVAAHRYTARQRLARWLARHRLAVAVGAIATVLLVLVGALGLAGVLGARDTARAAAVREGIRADEALLANARAIAATDPTRAAALLAQMPIDSPVWSRARDVVEATLAAGPSRGHALDIAEPRGSLLVAAPGGDAYALTAGSAVYVGDAALRSPPRQVAVLAAAPDALAWRSDGELVAVVAHRLVAIELAGGAPHVLDAGGPVTDAVTDPATHRIFALAGGRVREVGGRISVRRPASSIARAAASCFAPPATWCSCPTAGRRSSSRRWRRSRGCARRSRARCGSRSSTSRTTSGSASTSAGRRGSRCGRPGRPTSMSRSSSTPTTG